MGSAYPATKTYPARWYDPALDHLVRAAVKVGVPGRWFGPAVPDEASRRAATGRLKLEIVSHCWNYANLLAYQLSSFALYPPTQATLTVTVFHAEEDRDTRALLEFFSGRRVENVVWNWQPIPKSWLFRRAIGRNMALKSSAADWVWVTDCDILFRHDCLDALAGALQGRKDVLLYPREERITDLLADDDPMLNEGREPRVIDIDENDGFERNSIEKAKGAFQIVHGDVARACGYCPTLPVYQTPSERWEKTREDPAFRWLVGSEGAPIDVPGLYRIRHISKGRYKQDSVSAKIRGNLRKMTDG